MAEVSLQFNAVRDDFLEPRNKEEFPQYRMAETADRVKDASQRIADLLSMRRELELKAAEIEARVAENVQELQYLGKSWVSIAPLVELSTAGAHRRYGQRVDSPGPEHNTAE
jgi:AraC-like DNA-binding protein